MLSKRDYGVSLDSLLGLLPYLGLQLGFTYDVCDEENLQKLIDGDISPEEAGIESPVFFMRPEELGFDLISADEDGQFDSDGEEAAEAAEDGDSSEKSPSSIT